MPVLLSLALLFSQAFGFQHGFDHSKLLRHVDSVEQMADQSANDYFKDFGTNKNKAHSCVALDGICFASFALTNQFSVSLLGGLIEDRLVLIQRHHSKKQYFSYLSRAPPPLS